MSEQRYRCIKSFEVQAIDEDEWEIENETNVVKVGEIYSKLADDPEHLFGINATCAMLNIPILAMEQTLKDYFEEVAL